MNLVYFDEFVISSFLACQKKETGMNVVSEVIRDHRRHERQWQRGGIRSRQPITERGDHGILETRQKAKSRGKKISCRPGVV